MATQPIVPPPTGNPILDNPTMKSALAAQMGKPQPQTAQMPPGGQPQAQPAQRTNELGTPLMGPSNQQPTVTPARGTVEGDQAKRAQMISEGPGVSQIAHKIETSHLGQAHPTLGKILGIGAQGLAELGNLGLSIAAPRAAEMIPGTTMHHNLELSGLNRQIGTEEGERGKEAATEHERAATNAINNPQEKYAPLPTEQGIQAFNPKTGEAKPLTTATGQPLQPFRPEHVKTIEESAYESLTQGGSTPLEALDKIYGSKNTKTEDLPHLYLDALQSGDTQRAALIKRAHEDTQVKPTQPPGVTMIVPQADGTQKVERLTAGQTVAPGAQTAAGVNAVNTPTSQMRTAGTRAEMAAQEIPGVIQEVNALKSQLGPVAGRWSEFMQGKVGAPNPQIAGLRSDLVYLSSAVALAHAVGRLPENLRMEFDNMINAPKQSPENIIAVLEHTQKWMQDNANAMKGGASGSATQGTPPPGAKIVKFEDIK